MSCHFACLSEMVGAHGIRPWTSPVKETRSRRLSANQPSMLLRPLEEPLPDAADDAHHAGILPDASIEFRKIRSTSVRHAPATVHGVVFDIFDSEGPDSRQMPEERINARGRHQLHVQGHAVSPPSAPRVQYPPAKVRSCSSRYRTPPRDASRINLEQGRQIAGGLVSPCFRREGEYGLAA